MNGNWVFKDKDSITVYHATYEHGACQKCYREDLTTGDIVHGTGKLGLHSIIMDNFTAIEQQVDRGHSSWHKYDCEIEQKSPTRNIENRTQGAFNLSGRSLVGGLPRPRHNVPEEGRVVVDVTVNPAGYVIAASINAQTNTPSTDLRNAAMEAAQKARFNAIDGTDNQVVTINYDFKLR